MPPQEGPYEPYRQDDEDRRPHPGEGYGEPRPEVRAPREPARATFDQHPLFPLQPGEHEYRDIRRVSFIRRAPSGRPLQGGKTWSAEEMREWPQVARVWGGGAYKAVAKDARGTILGYCPAAEGEWVELDGPSKPMVDPEEDEAVRVSQRQPPASTPAPASALPPELTGALTSLARNLERTNERLDRIEADRRRPEGEGLTEKLVLALVNRDRDREPPPPPPPAKDPLDVVVRLLEVMDRRQAAQAPPPPPAKDPLDVVKSFLEIARQQQAPAPPPPPPAAPTDPLAQFASTMETMQRLGLGPAAGGTDNRLVDGALALAGRFLDAEARERSSKADLEKERIAAEKDVEVARQHALAEEARVRAEVEARSRAAEQHARTAQPVSATPPVPQATPTRRAEPVPAPPPPPAAVAPAPAPAVPEPIVAATVSSVPPTAPTASVPPPFIVAAAVAPVPPTAPAAATPEPIVAATVAAVPPLTPAVATLEPIVAAAVAPVPPTAPGDVSVTLPPIVAAGSEAAPGSQIPVPPRSPHSPPVASSVAASASPAVAAPPPPPSIVVDMSEIPEDVRGVLQDALSGVPVTETAKVADLFAKLKKLSRESRAKFLKQFAPSLSDSDCTTLAEAMMEVDGSMLLSFVLPSLGAQMGLAQKLTHLNGSNTKPVLA